MYEKRVHHEKILIVIPTCLKYIHRALTIVKTWGKDLPKHIHSLHFF